MLSEIETKALKSCCEINENITISVKKDNKQFIYKSRFLHVDFDRKIVIIDMPSPDTHNAEPLGKGEPFEAFFTYKNFRYLFPSKIIEFAKFKIQQLETFAAKIRIPIELQDGDKREYFRVQTKMRPPVSVAFNIYEEGSDTPIMSSLVDNTPKEFTGQMVDISGGGFSMRTKPGDKPFLLDKGDVINARFRLKADYDEMEIWSEVRNKRKYKGTEITVWGLQFLEGEKNRHMRFFRNKIMRFVVERQREMLAK
jgi:c-di-GMP-binding flagellar brake protein YcgR